EMSKRGGSAAVVIALATLVGGCGEEQYGDLKEELNKISKDLPRKVDPLPVVKPYEPVAYQASDLPDPFGPAKIELVTKAAASVTSKFKPDDTRPKEPLEAFPLE